LLAVRGGSEQPLSRSAARSRVKRDFIETVLIEVDDTAAMTR
jgi:hypothetical protein